MAGVSHSPMPTVNLVITSSIITVMSSITRNTGSTLLSNCGTSEAIYVIKAQLSGRKHSVL